MASRSARGIMPLEADGVVKTPLEVEGVDTTVRGGDANAPPKDGVVTASKTFAEVWPEEVWAEEVWAEVCPEETWAAEAWA
jgi:hypothetical protein